MTMWDESGFDNDTTEGVGAGVAGENGDGTDGCEHPIATIRRKRTPAIQRIRAGTEIGEDILSVLEAMVVLIFGFLSVNGEPPLTEHIWRMRIRRCKNTFNPDAVINNMRK